MMSNIQAGVFFFFNDTATTEIYTLSLHHALPISRPGRGLRRHPRPARCPAGRRVAAPAAAGEGADLGDRARLGHGGGGPRPPAPPWRGARGPFGAPAPPPGLGPSGEGGGGGGVPAGARGWGRGLARGHPG